MKKMIVFYNRCFPSFSSMSGKGSYNLFQSMYYIYQYILDRYQIKNFHKLHKTSYSLYKRDDRYLCIKSLPTFPQTSPV